MFFKLFLADPTIEVKTKRAYRKRNPEDCLKKAQRKIIKYKKLFP